MVESECSWLAESNISKRVRAIEYIPKDCSTLVHHSYTLYDQAIQTSLCHSGPHRKAVERQKTITDIRNTWKEAQHEHLGRRCKWNSRRCHETSKEGVGSHADLQATEERGENARLSSFVGAMALGDLVKSTLGPKVSNLPLLHEEVADPPGNEQDSSYVSATKDSRT